jgi:hypothetical protein
VKEHVHAVHHLGATQTAGCNFAAAPAGLGLLLLVLLLLLFRLRFVLQWAVIDNWSWFHPAALQLLQTPRAAHALAAMQKLC